MKFRYSLSLTKDEREALIELLNGELDISERPQRTSPQWSRFEGVIAQLREKVLATK